MFVTSRTVKAALVLCSCSISVHQRNICWHSPVTAVGGEPEFATRLQFRPFVTCSDESSRNHVRLPLSSSCLADHCQLSRTLSSVAIEVDCCHDLANETLLKSFNEFCASKKNSLSSRINFNAFTLCKIIMHICCFNFIISSNHTRVLQWNCNSSVHDLDVCVGFIVPANHEHVGFLCS